MRLFKNFSMYSIGRILVDGLKFFLIPMYTAYIPIAEYGLYTLLVSIKDILFNLPAVISTSSYSRFFFKDKEKSFLPSLVSLFMLGFSILAILTLLLSGVLRRLLFESFPQYHYLIFVALGIAFFQFFIKIRKHEAIMRSKAHEFLIISLLTGLVPLLLIIFLVVHQGMTIDGLFLGLFLPFIILAVFIFLTRYRLILRKPDTSLMKKYFSYGFPLAFREISTKILKAGDRFVIHAFIGTTAVGAYSFVYLITSALRLFLIQPFGHAIHPIIMRNEENKKVLQKTITNASVAIMASVSIFSIIFSFFIEHFLVLFVRDESYLQYTPLIYLLSVAFVIISAKGLTQKGLSLANKTHIIMWITIIAAIVNIVLNIIMIPAIGVWGAALATIISHLLMLILFVHYSEKHYHIRYPKARMAIIISAYSVIIASFFMLQGLFYDVVLKSVLVVVYLALLWFFRILTKKNIEYVIKTIRKA